jgi:hypothetical protein
VYVDEEGSWCGVWWAIFVGGTFFEVAPRPRSRPATEIGRAANVKRDEIGFRGNLDMFID